MSQIVPDETILGLLAANPGHGYQLLECFRDPAQLGEVWHLSTSQLYAVLKRLEKAGFITGQEIPSADAPARVQYRITQRGRKQLEGWLHEPQPSASVRRVRVEFLSRLYIARLLNIPTQPLVARQKKACQQQLAALITQREAAAPGVGFLALELVIAQLQAILGWIDRCELMPQPL